jgi:hypothetical protein
MDEAPGTRGTTRAVIGQQFPDTLREQVCQSRCRKIEAERMDASFMPDRCRSENRTKRSQMMSFLAKM